MCSKSRRVESGWTAPGPGWKGGEWSSIHPSQFWMNRRGIFWLWPISIWKRKNPLSADHVPSAASGFLLNFRINENVLDRNTPATRGIHNIGMVTQPSKHIIRSLWVDSYCSDGHPSCGFVGTTPKMNGSAWCGKWLVDGVWHNKWIPQERRNTLREPNVASESPPAGHQWDILLGHPTK